MSTVSQSLTAPVALQFSINDELLPQILDGLTQDEAWRAPTSQNNPLLWVAGHIVQTRAFVLHLLGESFDTGWKGLFDRGAKLQDRSQYPSLDEIGRVMRAVNARFSTALASATEEQLDQPASTGIPELKTVADELAFFSLHESYHVGQLAFIRKSLGYPGIVG